ATAATWQCSPPDTDLELSLTHAVVGRWEFEPASGRRGGARRGRVGVHFSSTAIRQEAESEPHIPGDLHVARGDSRVHTRARALSEPDGVVPTCSMFIMLAYDDREVSTHVETRPRQRVHLVWSAE